MIDDGAQEMVVSERFAALRRTLRPAALRPGVGGGLSLILARVGSNVWTAVQFEAVDETTMTVTSDSGCTIGDEMVLRCSGVEVGDVAFRVRVDASTAVGDGVRLLLRPIAMSQMTDER